MSACSNPRCGCNATAGDYVPLDISEAAPVLGPLQPIWDAWLPIAREINAQPESHFAATLRYQLVELDDASEQYRQSVNSEAEDACLAHYMDEVVDVISVALNWLRWLGLNDKEAAFVIRRRAKRYADPMAIFAKYRGILLPTEIT